MSKHDKQKVAILPLKTHTRKLTVVDFWGKNARGKSCKLVLGKITQKVIVANLQCKNVKVAILIIQSSQLPWWYIMLLLQ